MNPIEVCLAIIAKTNMKTGHDFIDTDLIIGGCKVICKKCKYKTQVMTGDVSIISNLYDFTFEIGKNIMTCSEHIIKNIIE
jgi:hypothetical protein